jgi:PAS domain S-box-containing protein
VKSGSAPRGGSGVAAPAATRRFPAAASSVSRARRFLLERLLEHGRDVADELVLMVSELATNAVQLAAGPFEMTVTVDEPTSIVRVEVSDLGPGYPIPTETISDSSHGRGLHIVRALADAWGVEMHRDRPGKTVWFSAGLPECTETKAGAKTDAAVAAAAPFAAAAHDASAHRADSRWPERGARAVLDGLFDAVVATDVKGVIRYANRATEELTGWPEGSLIGRSARDLVPDSMAGSLEDGLAELLWSRADRLHGRRVPVVIKRADGCEIDTELVLSMLEHPVVGRVVVGIFRPRENGKLQRWSGLTTELLEILADVPIDDPTAERLLSTLGRRLGWDVTTLWALSANHELTCRHVWTRTPDVAPHFAREKSADPKSGSEGLPRWVIEHNEPLWVPDLTRDERFVTDALESDGLQSAYAFPIRYRGACVGIVKMLSRDQRDRDPSVVELMDAVGDHLGELLHASAQAAEREQLVEELLDARRRNEFLLLATQVLSEVVDYREMVERLAQVAVPVMADLCLIDILDEDGTMRRMAAWHADPAKRALAAELRSSYPPEPEGPHPIISVMHSGASMWSDHMDDEFLRGTSRDVRHFAILKALGFTSYMTVPLCLQNEQVLGTVTLVSAGSGRRFSEKDLGLAEQLAKQVSSVIIRARAFERERRISHELQRNMLPDAIPAIGGWDVAARYLPAAVGVEVGGDWYDVVPITDDLVALVVGDVEGHDLEAAKVMSRLRHTLGLLLLEEQDPGRALERLNRVSLSHVGARLATALIGVLDTRTGAIVFSSAGHHSPVRVTPGSALELVVPPGPPLGVQRSHYKVHEFQLEEACLLMFTDGLIERRGVPLDERLEQLEEALLGALPCMEPGPVADYVIDAMTADGRSADDIVVLTACRAAEGGAPPPLVTALGTSGPN